MENHLEILVENEPTTYQAHFTVTRVDQGVTFRIQDNNGIDVGMAVDWKEAVSIAHWIIAQHASTTRETTDDPSHH